MQLENTSHIALFFKMLRNLKIFHIFNINELQTLRVSMWPTIKTLSWMPSLFRTFAMHHCTSQRQDCYGCYESHIIWALSAFLNKGKILKVKKKKGITHLESQSINSQNYCYRCCKVKKTLKHHNVSISEVNERSKR